MHDITSEVNNKYNTVSHINSELTTNATEFITSCEERYHHYIKGFANMAAKSGENTVIMVAGPSSAGKTTSSKILCDALAAQGIESEMVSLDDFFIGTTGTPMDENGKRDYETVHALNIEQIHDCFETLTQTGTCNFPQFDFSIGEPSVNKRHIQLDKNDVVIVEGLHALNSLVLSAIDAKHVLKLYINVDRRVYDDNGNVILSRRDLRLIRRISRDAIYRNSNISNTLDMWPAVQHGEREYLFPTSHSADYVINTFHSYEPALFKNLVLPLVFDLDKTHPQYDFALKIAAGLDKFVSIPTDSIPKNSLLREFF